MNTSDLEDEIRNCISNAIWDYEYFNGKITNVEIEANVSIDPDGVRYINVNVYEGD